MKNSNPTKTMDMLEQGVSAWREFAPDATFGGVKLADFEAKVAASQQDRVDLKENDNERAAIMVKRENNDEIGLSLRDKLVRGVVGDVNFGPDSAFYESLGYKRKSNYASGLTRKTKKTDED